uniref:Uncharacterized protein n=1 Tax=Rhizophora mucronata TaxID=61149 RepID=A0A2P2KMA6_RHIMU
MIFGLWWGCHLIGTWSANQMLVCGEYILFCPVLILDKMVHCRNRGLMNNVEMKIWVL